MNISHTEDGAFGKLPDVSGDALDSKDAQFVNIAKLALTNGDPDTYKEALALDEFVNQQPRNHTVN